MNSVVEKLVALMGEQYEKHKAIRRDVAFLKDELGSMNAVLKKLAGMEELDPQTMDWRNQVMGMAFDIEDSMDDFMHRVCEDANTDDTGFIAKIRQYVNELRVRHHFTKQLQELKSRVIEVSERRKRYKLDEGAYRSSFVAIDTGSSALYTEAGNLVGIDDPIDGILKLLDMEGDASVQSLRVVSIVGFGGLGKTTLANEVYRKLRGKYDCEIFISVSQRPDLLSILSRIIHKLGIAQLNHAVQLEDLIENIRGHLKYRRYFVVVDDIWDASVWEILRCAFPDNLEASKVITTTRIESVAKACCAYRPEFIYRMRPLDDQNSAKLFIVESDISLSSNLRTNPTLEGMRQVLKLSYNNLPLHLKNCLLYIGMYPEDHSIEKEDLVRLWAAEGFVSNITDEDTEKVAGSYFNELVNRSMIQPTYTDYNGEVWRCKVHDMILDLIRLKSEEENFLRVVDNARQMALSLQSRVRRLSLHVAFGENQDKATAASLNMTHIRSFAVFGNSSFIPPISKFKCIRVLNLKDRHTDEHESIDLTPIYKLFQLRYLNVSRKARLPAQMRYLKCLETLDLKKLDGDVPSDIVHLPYLMHWLVPAGKKLPDGICSMKSLCTLRYFDVSVPRWIGQHHNLSKLLLTVNTLIQDDIDLLAQLPNLCHLELDIRKSLKERILIHGGGVAFPVLKYLLLSCFKTWLLFETGAMPNIQKLELKHDGRGLEGDNPSVPEGIAHLLNLKELHVVISDGFSIGTGITEADAEATYRNALKMHPRHRDIKIRITLFCLVMTRPAYLYDSDEGETAQESQ
ncbi:hypothetical protein HU200_029368 [Digitaria exilis]|uniref:Uncharacterized protein n=1 Tax=Digitaria exilis TaxID=1010633 RepID=A0A835BQU5_9POAL|nr:hypothetical protein HU200_029368 [Digitaria exilis]